MEKKEYKPSTSIKEPFYWFFFGLILIAGRFSLLCSLYMLDTPTGSTLVADYNRFIWHTLYSEIGCAMAITLFFCLLSILIKGNKVKYVKVAAVFFAFIYLFLSGVDDELQRWMSQKLSLSFLKTYTYAFTDTGLVSKIALGGIGHFLLTVAIIFVTTVGLAVLSIKSNITLNWTKPRSKKSIICLSLIAFFTIFGCTSHLWYHYSPRRWDRIRPVLYGLVSDIFEFSEMQVEPSDFREGITLLGGNPDKEYPFWNDKQDDKSILEAFKAKPLSEKKDILLLTIESLRGWTFDMRVESNCKLFPNICKLAKRSLYFPNTYSVGNPSVEGLLGIMTGVISIPNKTLLRDFPNTRLKAFSEILSDAGYYTEVILGADPRFDNEEGWYSKWFHYHEFKPEYADDVSSAIRFVERYKNRPKNQPTFFHWMSLSMHTPFVLPEHLGETPKENGKAYLRAAVYMDSAVGIILDSLEKDPRFENTLVILTGDHSTPNGEQQKKSEHIGLASEGYTWISLMFSNPEITPKIDSRVISQGNIAKTIIETLGLNVSNHYMGVNLLSDSLEHQKLPSIYSFKYGSMGMREDSMSYYISPVDGNTSAIAQKILLEPEWDVSNPADGFVTGTPVKMEESKLKEKARQMRAVANAWKFLVYKNKIMPAENN